MSDRAPAPLDVIELPDRDAMSPEAREAYDAETQRLAAETCRLLDARIIARKLRELEEARAS